MTITIKIKQVYGNKVYYPICNQAKVFADIANTKTLTYATILKIKELGYEIKIEQETI